MLYCRLTIISDRLRRPGTPKEVTGFPSPVLTVVLCYCRARRPQEYRLPAWMILQLRSSSCPCETPKAIELQTGTAVICRCCCRQLARCIKVYFVCYVGKRRPTVKSLDAKNCPSGRVQAERLAAVLRVDWCPPRLSLVNCNAPSRKYILYCSWKVGPLHLLMTPASEMGRL